jgi:predicted dehydrogenase
MNCIGIIGIGYWGNKVLNTLEKINSIKIKYLCDLNYAALKDYETKYICTTDYNNILQDKDVNIVFIITPLSNHYELICKSLNFNKNVFVEKPICKTMDELNHIIEVAKKSNKLFFCDYIFNYSDKINKLKEIFNENKNEILYIELNRENFGNFYKDSNVIFDLLPHDLSIIYKLFDYDNKIKIKNVDKIFNDDLLIKTIINFEINNIPGFINISWLNEEKNRIIKIFCKNKIIIYDDSNDIIKIFNYDISTFNKNIEYKEINNNNEPLYNSISYFLNMINNYDNNLYNSQIIMNEKIIKNIQTAINFK